MWAVSNILAIHTFDCIVLSIKFGLTSCEELATPLLRMIMFINHNNRTVQMKRSFKISINLLTDKPPETLSKCFKFLDITMAPMYCTSLLPSYITTQML